MVCELFCKGISAEQSRTSTIIAEVMILEEAERLEKRLEKYSFSPYPRTPLYAKQMKMSNREGSSNTGKKPPVKSKGTLPPSKERIDKTGEKTCHACGKPGHFARDLVCPKYGQPRPSTKLGAVHDETPDNLDKISVHSEKEEVQLEEEEVLQPQESNKQDERLAMVEEEVSERPCIGSQYSSEGKDYELEGYKEYSDNDAEE